MSFLYHVTPASRIHSIARYGLGATRPHGPSFGGYEWNVRGPDGGHLMFYTDADNVSQWWHKLYYNLVQGTRERLALLRIPFSALKDPKPDHVANDEQHNSSNWKAVGTVDPKSIKFWAGKTWRSISMFKGRVPNYEDDFPTDTVFPPKPVEIPRLTSPLTPTEDDLILYPSSVPDEFNLVRVKSYGLLQMGRHFFRHNRLSEIADYVARIGGYAVWLSRDPNFDKAASGKVELLYWDHERETKYAMTRAEMGLPPRR